MNPGSGPGEYFDSRQMDLEPRRLMLGLNSYPHRPAEVQLGLCTPTIYLTPVLCSEHRSLSKVWKKKDSVGNFNIKIIS